MHPVNNTISLYSRLKTVFSTQILLFSIISLLAVQLLFVFGSFSTEWLEYFLYDSRHAVSAMLRQPDPGLLVVGIDMRTLSESGVRWPWPRDYFAEALQKISDCRPAGIVIDVLFQNPDSENSDNRLCEEISRQKNVILISILEEKKSDAGISLSRFSSLKQIRDSALAEGFVWGIPSRDGKLRQFQVKDERMETTSCALKTAQAFYLGRLQQISFPNRLPVVFARKNGGVPVVSLHDVVSGVPDIKELIRDRVIVLGVTARIVHDFHNTPIGVISGAEILAASIDTIVSNRFGTILFDIPWIRVLLAFAGAFIAWFTIMGSGGLILPITGFTVLCLLMMMVFEVVLVHLPIAPFILCWLATVLFLSIVRYFDNLFSLQKIQLEAGNAKVVQEQLLPSGALEFNGYRVAGVSCFANELGGDYFDYFVVKDRYILAIIADATGHGMPAALAVAVGKASLLAALSFDLAPDEIAGLIGKTLFEALNRRLMMTAAILWIDTHANQFEYRNCGHPYPYLITPDNKVSQLEASGLFLGTRKDYKPGKPFYGSLQAGERLIFYTDGLIETMPDGEETDAYNLFRDYLMARPKLTIEQSCHDILGNHPFVLLKQPLPDDFTVMIIERVPGAPDSSPVIAKDKEPACE